MKGLAVEQRQLARSAQTNRLIGAHVPNAKHRGSKGASLAFPASFIRWNYNLVLTDFVHVVIMKKKTSKNKYILLQVSGRSCILLVIGKSS